MRERGRESLRIAKNEAQPKTTLFKDVLFLSSMLSLRGDVFILGAVGLRGQEGVGPSEAGISPLHKWTNSGPLQGQHMFFLATEPVLCPCFW